MHYFNTEFLFMHFATPLYYSTHKKKTIGVDLLIAPPNPPGYAYYDNNMVSLFQLS